jgi:Fe-S cluster assembly iron-binding protein IscA
LSLDEAKETDVAKEVDGIGFVVDEDTDKQFGNVIVDYSSGFLGKRFMVNYAGGGSFRGGCS